MSKKESIEGVNFYGSEKLPDSTELIAQFQKIVDHRFARFIMTKLTDQKKFEHLLGVFAGVEESSGIKESTEVKMIETALKRGMKTFHVDGMDTIKNALKEKFVRKGVALTLRSVAKYGITKPQIFDAPLMVVWNTTKQCNLNCLHCYANAGIKHSDELTLEQKLRVIDMMDEAGVTMIAFSGGEPLISPDFWKIAEYASSKGFYTTIATNGTLLTKSVVDRLAEVGIKYVEISLDSPDPEVHNKFRGQQMAWERTVQGIKNVVEKGVFDTAIATTATRYNYKQMDRMLDLAIQLKVKKFIVFNFVPTGRGKEIIDEDLTPKEREDLLNFLYDKWQQKVGPDIYSTSPEYSRIGINKILEGTGKTYSPTHFATMETGSNGIAMAEFIGGCGAGRVYAALEDNGDLEPCVFLPIRVGNVLKDGLKNIWENSNVLKDLRDRDHLEGICGTCPFKYSCGGCRARAYGYYGDYMQSDPGCLLNESAYEEIVFKLHQEPVRV
ncbi:radical SAM/SPASM domain-containing protein [Thermoplasma sp. Kam2015]|uniref:radical SAM/SPASM domain-containing protein n=1 Tax=Thermoplasma sp. Kam2015 TaxID=2094122 RepID=UPI000D85C43E|nr:radical SAM protein [Thermoplasma sp. Kam2015]PYB69058.1 radical SAM/SPASM domain-containing protein [Thermoplasma sp. Kam2015]